MSSSRIRSVPLWMALLLVSAGLVVPSTSARADEAGSGGDFVALTTPGRLLDTRSGLGAPAGLRGPGSVTAVPALGAGGVPAAGVSAVLVDLTLINPTAGTYLTIWPEDSPQPPVSMINAAGGTIVSGTAVVPVGPSGLLNVRNNSGNTHIAIDVHGYHLSGQSGTPGQGGFIPVPSQRLVDTRSGLGAPAGVIPAGGSITATIGDGSPVPAGAAAAFLSITTVGATQQGYLQAHPAGATPTGSTMDFASGATSVGTAVKLSTDGRITFRSVGAATNVVVDVLGYYSADPTRGAGLRTRPAARILSTVPSGHPIPANAVVDVQVGGLRGLPTRGIAGAVLGLTTVNPSAAGYLRAWPLGEPEPTTSVHNFPAGTSRASLVVIKAGTDGKVRIRNTSGAPLHLIADLQGWYEDPIPSVPVAPNSRVAVRQLPPPAGARLGAVEYAFVDDQGRVQHGRQPDPDWFDTLQWSTLADESAFTGPPALGLMPDNRVQVAAQAIDSNIQTMTQSSPGAPAWGSWDRLGGSMAAPPVAGRLENGVTVLFAVDADGRLWQYRQDRAMPSWHSLGDTRLTGGIAVVPARVGSVVGLRIVGIGTDGAVKTALYDWTGTGGLAPWVDLGGSSFNGTPAVEVLPGYRTRIVVRDGDGLLHTKYQALTGGFPAEWEAVGDLTTFGSPDVILDPFYGRLCVLARGTDNRIHAIWETAMASGVWGTWADTGIGPVATDPTAAEFTTSNGEQWIIVARDADGTVRYAIRTAMPGASRSAGQPSFQTGALPAAD
nr:hypothetical protein [Micromonospora sp. DSM 115978]